MEEDEQGRAEERWADWESMDGVASGAVMLPGEPGGHPEVSGQYSVGSAEALSQWQSSRRHRLSNPEGKEGKKAEAAKAGTCGRGPVTVWAPRSLQNSGERQLEWSGRDEGGMLQGLCPQPSRNQCPSKVERSQQC